MTTAVTTTVPWPRTTPRRSTAEGLPAGPRGRSTPTAGPSTSTRWRTLTSLPAGRSSHPPAGSMPIGRAGPEASFTTVTWCGEPSDPSAGDGAATGARSRTTSTSLPPGGKVPVARRDGSSPVPRLLSLRYGLEWSESGWSEGGGGHACDAPVLGQVVGGHPCSHWPRNDGASCQRGRPAHPAERRCQRDAWKRG